jgi:hypothetical protein
LERILAWHPRERSTIRKNSMFRTRERTREPANGTKRKPAAARPHLTLIRDVVPTPASATRYAGSPRCGPQAGAESANGTRTGCCGAPLHRVDSGPPLLGAPHDADVGAEDLWLGGPEAWPRAPIRPPADGGRPPMADGRAHWAAVAQGRLPAFVHAYRGGAFPGSGLSRFAGNQSTAMAILAWRLIAAHNRARDAARPVLH